MYRCKKCAKQYSESVSFCEECGSEVVPAAVCEECGMTLSDGAKVCASCGAPVEEAADRMCEECGAALAVGAAVCRNCGAPVSGASMYTALPTVNAAAGSTAVQLTAAKKPSIAFTVGNVIFLLTLIPATIILLGEIFVFRASGVMEESFGYFGFSKTFNYLTDILDVLERLGVGSFDTARILTSIFGFTWTVVIAALFGVAIHFISGIANAGKGRLLDKICFMPLLYLLVSFLFCVLVDAALLNPINDVLSSGIVGIVNDFVGLKLSAELGTPVIALACIGILNVAVYAVLKLVGRLGLQED